MKKPLLSYASYKFAYFCFVAVSILSSINIYIGCNIDSLVTETDNTVVIDADDTPVVDIAAVLQNDYKYKTPTISDELEHQESDIHDCGSSPDFHNFFLQPKQTSRSIDNEDKIVYEKFFKNNIDVEGTYIELGAYDGVREANTRFFDTCLKWKGLLIEGNPRMYEKLVTNRPNTHRMSFAPSCLQWNQTVTFYNTKYTNSGMKGHATQYDSKDNITYTSNIQVPCGPIGPVIEHVFPGKVDLLPRINFFSLDVEGAEKLVLDTIDFSRVQIDIFMIEIQNNNCKKGTRCEVRDQVRKIMNDAGYVKYEDIVRFGDVYIHPNFQSSPFKKKDTNLRQQR